MSIRFNDVLDSGANPGFLGAYIVGASVYSRVTATDNENNYWIHVSLTITVVRIHLIDLFIFS
jgi:hypothetical protein